MRLILIFIALLMLTVEFLTFPLYSIIRDGSPVNKGTNRLVRLYFDEKFTTDEALRSGLDFEGATVKDGVWADIYVNDREYDYISKAGIRHEVLIDDVESYNLRRLRMKDADQPQFEMDFGSMGGFYTLEEIADRFDKLIISHPGLITDGIAGYTIEGSPIYYYVIGNCADSSHEVLLTGAHHAREPGGTFILVNFIKDLIERYDASDPEANFLLDNRCIYIVPVVNPDGYNYNCITMPDGGGMWRKNRRKINDSTYGVDLNRNYGPQQFWDYPNGGSATEPWQNTYRGTEPFSEPETRAIRDLCLSHHFKFALNYHTYGNLLIIPFGAGNKQTDDSLLFRGFCYDANARSKYVFGLNAQTVGYSSRGTAEDWMYLPAENKQKIIAITPEVGTAKEGFWPTKAAIAQQVQDNRYQLYQAVWSAGANVRPVDVYCRFDADSTRLAVIVKMQNTGSDYSLPDLELTLNSVNDSVYVINPLRKLKTLSPAEQQTEEFKLGYRNGFANGMPARFIVGISGGGIVRRDTVMLRMFLPVVKTLFDGGGLSVKWQTERWGIEYDVAEKANVLSDSPGKIYRDSSSNYLLYNEYINLSGYSGAVLEFTGKWAIERDFDFAVIQASTDSGGSWQSLISPRMVKGYGLSGSRQVDGSWGLHGHFPDWVVQQCPLDSLLGKSILLRLALLADKQKAFDGWKIRSIKLLLYDPLAGITENIGADEPEAYLSSQIIFSGEPLAVKFRNSFNNCPVATIRILDIFDNCLETYGSNLSTYLPRLTLPTGGLSQGVYFIQLMLGGRYFILKFEIIG